MNERTIDVQVVDGRVYHRNLEFMIDDVPVTLLRLGRLRPDDRAGDPRARCKRSGSAASPRCRRLIGQVIEIPVSGTFTHWKVDERAVGNFLGQAAQSAVSGALGDELNKAFDGLFKPK